MKKIKIFGITKSKNHCVFIVEKRKATIEKLREFLHNLDFPSHKTTQILSPMGDSDNNYSARRYSSKLYEDKYFYLNNCKYKIDIFCGKSRIVISIFMNSSRHREIMKKLLTSFSL